MAEPIIEEVTNLELQSIIGFDGSVINGLKLHRDGIHVVYPLGSKVVIQNWKTKEQSFMTGHTHTISTLDISPNGKYITSGQMNHMGFKASVIIWNFEEKSLHSKHELHKVRVESVTFSCDNKYVISLGGRDDGSIVVWDIEANSALCGNLASTGTMGDAYLVHAASRRGLCFYSGGMETLRVWTMNPSRRSLNAVNVGTGSIRRNILCMAVDDRDEFLYCGTTTGDIMKIKVNFSYDLKVMEPEKTPVLLGSYGKYVSKKKIGSGDPSERYQNGVTALMLVPNDLDDKLIVGAGNGTVEIVKEKEVALPKDTSIRIPSQPQLRTVKSAKVNAYVTTLSLRRCELYVGTKLCEIYTINFETFEVLLQITCHTDAIFAVAFPYDYSRLFATSSKNDIRIWQTETSTELLRITVPNIACTSIAFTQDGKSIISGWNDGIIRAFTPESGRLMYAIHNAHNRGVSAVGITSDGRTLVSGGGEGQVRVWDIKPTQQTLKGILKEHKGPISSIHLTRTNNEAVSASTDGTCIIWDIVHMVRQQVLFANTQFMCAKYYPTGVQVLTVGTDRKIAYWEVYDGSLLRELEGSTAGAINTVDINLSGEIIATGGNDQIVKVWKYMEGIATHVGIGHAGIITCICFSPDNRFIVSVSADGGIFKWKCPYFDVEDLKDKTETESIVAESISSRSTCSLREEKWEKENEKAESVKWEKENEKPESVKSFSSHASSKSSKASKIKENQTKDTVCLCDHLNNSEIPCICSDERMKTSELSEVRHAEDTNALEAGEETIQGRAESIKSSGSKKSLNSAVNIDDVICGRSDISEKEKASEKSSGSFVRKEKPVCKCVEKLEQSLKSRGKHCNCTKKLRIIACQNKSTPCSCAQKLREALSASGEKKCDCVETLWNLLRRSSATSINSKLSNRTNKKV